MLSGEDIRLFRLAQRLTQRQLAKKVDLPQSRISAIENGLRLKQSEEKSLLRVLAGIKRGKRA